MKSYKWNKIKNEELKKERGISFEDIVFYIHNNNLITVLENPNKIKYKNHKIFVIQVNKYAYVVPFVESDNEIFLKTIFPSRKYTKEYLGDKK